MNMRKYNVNVKHKQKKPPKDKWLMICSPSWIPVNRKNPLINPDPSGL